MGAFYAITDPGWKEVWNNLFIDWATASQARPVGALVFDYDGTLCDIAHRFLPHLDPEVAQRLTRVLNAGTPIGIATGRGHSVYRALRASLPESLWPQVTLGLYNGGVVFQLHEPIPEVGGDASLEPVMQALRRASDERFNFERRPVQINVEAGMPTWGTDELRRHVVLAMVENGIDLTTIKIATSGHSLDIVPAWSGKLRVVERLQERLEDLCGGVMRFGDRGDVDGNDFELLSDPLGISVDRVSGSFRTCWNLAPSGCSGPSALLRLLDAFTSSNGLIRLRLGALR